MPTSSSKRTFPADGSTLLKGGGFVAQPWAKAGRHDRKKKGKAKRNIPDNTKKRRLLTRKGTTAWMVAFSLITLTFFIFLSESRSEAAASLLLQLESSRLPPFRRPIHNCSVS